MDHINLELNEEILKEIKQCVVCDIPEVVFILLLPVSMIIFTHSQGGIVIGSALLVLILYGIYNIYRKLFIKRIVITNKKLVLAKQEYSFNNLKEIEMKQSLISKQLDIAVLKLHFIDEEILLYNIKTPYEIKELLEGIIEKK